MRIEAGGKIHYATDGTYVRCYPPLSQSQVDVLVGLLRRNGRCVNCVSAVEMDEGRFVIEPLEPRTDKWCEHER